MQDRLLDIRAWQQIHLHAATMWSDMHILLPTTLKQQELCRNCFCNLSSHLQVAPKKAFGLPPFTRGDCAVHQSGVLHCTKCIRFARPLQHLYHLHQLVWLREMDLLEYGQDLRLPEYKLHTDSTFPNVAAARPV